MTEPWSDPVVTDPLAITVLDQLLAGAATPPKALIPVYRAAAARYKIAWQVLAAINAVETDYGHDESTSSAGAVGWMQFMPMTWRRYAVRADQFTALSPDNPQDAIFTAARMLAADGGRSDIRKAVYAYNHSSAYVAEVINLAQAILDRTATPTGSAHAKLTAMLTAAKLLNGTPYVWGGGHAGWALAAGYDCSGFVSSVLHAAGYLSAPVTTQTLAASPRIENGVGRWVTIFDRTDSSGLASDHVIIDIHGQWWESGGSGGAQDVHRIVHVSASYLATFNRILHPQGL